MMNRVAINGFGRIGRLCLRGMLQRHRDTLSVVAVNDMADPQTNAHLFQYDTNYGVFAGSVETGEGMIRIDGQEIRAFNQKDPWNQPDMISSSTGRFLFGDSYMRNMVLWAIPLALARHSPSVARMIRRLGAPGHVKALSHAG